MFCTSCGKEVNKNANFCKYCGQEITADDVETKELREVKQHLEYETDETRKSDQKLISTDRSPDSDLATFVGKNYEYYERKWNAMDKNGTSWNFAAFFLSLLWLGYRKMYRTIFFISLFFLVIDILFHVISPNGIPDSIDNSIGISVAVVLGFLGNRLYKSHAEKKIRAIQESGIDRERKVNLLKKKGGRSGLGVIVGFLIFIGVYIVPQFVMPFDMEDEEADFAIDELRQVTTEDDPQAKLDLIEWNIYENTRFGYRLKYPSHWELGEESANGDGITLYAGPANEINVFALMSTEVFRAAATETIETDQGLAALVDYGELDSGRYYQSSLLENGIGYHLTALISNDFYDSQLPLLEEMVRSFEISEMEEKALEDLYRDGQTLVERIREEIIDMSFNEMSYAQKIVMLTDLYFDRMEHLNEQTRQLQNDPYVLSDPIWLDDTYNVLDDMDEIMNTVYQIEEIPEHHEFSNAFLNDMVFSSDDVTSLYRETIEYGDEALFAETLEEYSYLQEQFIDHFVAFEQELKYEY